MKKTVFLIAFLLACATAFAQTTLTPNVQLQVPAYQQTNWQVPIIYDLNLLDGILGGTQTLTPGQTTPNINKASTWLTGNAFTVSITGFTGGFPGQTIRIFCNDNFTVFTASATLKLSTSPLVCSNGFIALSLTLVNGVWNEIARTGGPGSGLNYQTIQNGSGTPVTQRPTVQFTGTAVASVVDDNTNNRTIVTLTANAGSGVTLQTNGTNNASQTSFNFQTGSAVNGLTITPTNPSGGNIQVALSGTLTDAGLTAAYSGVGNCATSPQAFVIGLTRNASPTCQQVGFSNLSGNIAVSQMNSGTSAGVNTLWHGNGAWLPVVPGDVSPGTNGQALMTSGSSVAWGTNFNSGLTIGPAGSGQLGIGLSGSADILVGSGSPGTGMRIGQITAGGMAVLISGGNYSIVGGPSTAGPITIQAGSKTGGGSNINGGSITLTPGTGDLSNGAIHLQRSVFNDESGFKHKRFPSPLGGTCPTGTTIGNSCTSANLTWGTAFADNNYTVSCTLTSVTNQPHLVTYTKLAAGAGITLTIATDLASAADAGADCIAVHD